MSLFIDKDETINFYVLYILCHSYSEKTQSDFYQIKIIYSLCRMCAKTLTRCKINVNSMSRQLKTKIATKNVNKKHSTRYGIRFDSFSVCC